MKLCKDCRHAEMQSGIWICVHPSAVQPAKTSPVTGETEPARGTSCDFTRLLIHNAEGEDYCGQEGKFWEPIAPPGFV